MRCGLRGRYWYCDSITNKSSRNKVDTAKTCANIPHRHDGGTKTTNTKQEMNYEVESGYYENGEPYVRVISDDDGILEDTGAMHAVDAEAKNEFGAAAKCVGEGSPYFASGREAGWEWSVQASPADRIKDYLDAAAWAKEAGEKGWDMTDEMVAHCLRLVADAMPTAISEDDKKRLCAAIAAI